MEEYEGESIVLWVLFGDVICLRGDLKLRWGMGRGRIREKFGGEEKYDQNSLYEKFENVKLIRERVRDQ